VADEVRGAVREILGEVGGLGTPADRLSDDADLFAAGLTSFATVNVMLAIEERFDLEFPDRLLRRDSFRSIAALAAVIEQLRAEAAA
jgi:acyl carrier protein